MSDLAHIAQGLALLQEPVVLPSGRHQTPSPRAIQAVKNLSENGGNRAQALRDAGYSEEVALSPNKVFLSPTVVAALKRLDLNEHSALKVIQDKLSSSKEHIALQAADMLLNVLGGYAPKRVEGKHTHAVGVYSMKDLREKMRKNQIDVLPAIIENE